MKEFGDACKRRILAVDVSKDKNKKIDSKNVGDVSASMDDEKLEVVDSCRCFGSEY